MAAVNDPDWDEALARLLAFFAALEFGGVEHRTRLAMQILEEARRRHEQNSALSAVRLTMDVAAESMEKWFVKALDGSSIAPKNRVAAGLFALRVTDVGSRWRNALLSGEPPAELCEALSRVSISTGPDLAISSMISRQMDYGPMGVIAQETWHKFAWAPIMRAAALWTAIFFLALYVYDRFFAV